MHKLMFSICERQKDLMKFSVKSILLLVVLLVSSACSAVFETAGLSADDAALLSGALAIDPTTASTDFDYSFVLDLSADGEAINVTTNGSVISDPANGNSSITMAGEVSGIPELGGATQPYDLEIRTIDTNDLYIRGVASLMDPSMDPDQWIQLPVDMTTQMALSQSPEIQSSGLMTDGQINTTALYGALNDGFFSTAGNYLTATRADDMDGLAHFVIDVQMSDWLASDELVAGLQELIPTLAGDLVPAEELEGGLAQLGMGLGMASMLADGGTYQLDYYVNSDGTLAEAMISLALEIDPAMMGGEGDPVTFDLVLDVNFRAFSADSVVIAPEGAINPMGG